MFSAFDKLKKSLSRTKDNLFGKIAQVVGGRKIDDDLLDEIEEILIEADVGVAATTRLTDSLRAKARENKATESDDVMALLKTEIADILSRQNHDLFPADAVMIGRPFSIASIGGGQEGVETYLDALRGELTAAMVLTGTASAASVSRDILWNV